MRHHSPLTLTLLCALSTLLLPGCGGGSEGTGGILGSVSGSTPISQLNASQKSELCTNVRQRIYEGWPASCKESSVLDALYGLSNSSQASTEERVQQCQVELQQCQERAALPMDEVCGGSPDYENCPLSSNKAYEHCDATSDLVAQCFTDFLEQIRQYSDLFSCQDLRTPVQEEKPIHELPAGHPDSCERLFAQCPGTGFAFAGCGFTLLE